MQKNRWMIGVLVAVPLLIGLNAGVSALTKTSKNDDGLPIEELKRFSEVYARIKQDYVEEVDGKHLIGEAIKGMLSGLDPHSDYLDADKFKDLQINTKGEFGGLGIEVTMQSGFVKVIAPIDDTPAKRAGVQAGDLIVRLDDKEVNGMTLSAAVNVMRGKPGTEIKLTIIREGEDKPLAIKIVRDTIKVKSVKQRLLEKDFGYVRITSFQTKTTNGLKTAIEQLIKENKGELSGLILDLRSNPGGVLGAAVGVSDAFLEGGKIVYTDGRIEDAKLEYKARKGDVLNGSPIVVLVDRGSASASEIVAGALQDHQRALIVGEKTFGKGSVQTVMPLDQATALKLTTARYFTPKGRSIQAEGIEPDIVVKTLKVNKENNENEIESTREANLNKHLSNLKVEEAKKDDKSEGDKKKVKAPTPQDDYQLYEALNILKAMSIVSASQKSE